MSEARTSVGSISVVWRIRDRSTFVALRERGQRGRKGTVTVIVLADPADAPVQPPRVAYAVSRRVGNAVVRNRVRRRLRAAVEQLALPSGAYLVSVGPNAPDLTFDQLRTEIDQAVRSTGAAGSTPRSTRG